MTAPKSAETGQYREGQHTKTNQPADVFAGMSAGARKPRLHLMMNCWRLNVDKFVRTWGGAISHTSVSFTSKSSSMFYLRKRPSWKGKSNHF